MLGYLSALNPAAPRVKADAGAVGKISISGDGATNTATKVGLAVESLLDGLHREVGVASVRHLPESNLGVSSKENILCAVGD